MMTKQNDTAALTDEQLEGVSGGKHIGPVGDGGAYAGWFQIE